MKSNYGKQGDFFDNAKLTLGIDFLWWFVPTHPELKINFYERVWPKKEVKRMYKMNKFDMPEDDSDPDKKMFSIEQRRAQFEKKVLWGLLMICILVWIFYA